MKIGYLKLETPRLLDQLHFYRDVLKLTIEEITDASFRVVTGFSIVEFVHREEATPYHVAFHIPANQEGKALQWLEERVEVLQSGGEKIIDFPAWNARSVYFYDADKNIIEFIARRHLYPPAGMDFSQHSILGVSEIGMATQDVKEKFEHLKRNFELQKFSGDLERFCAAGDDQGLFILIDVNKKDWIPTGDRAFASPFEIKFWEEQKAYQLTFHDDTIA